VDGKSGQEAERKCECDIVQFVPADMQNYATAFMCGFKAVFYIDRFSALILQ